MRRVVIMLAGCLLCLAQLAAPALAQNEKGNFVQYFENGRIDWETGWATAVGVGVPPAGAASKAQARPMAIRAATVVARRNLLEIVKGVQIDSSTTVQNYMVSDDTVVATVRGQLQNSQIFDTAYMSDGSIEVTVGVNLRGEFGNMILPKSMPFGTALGPEPSVGQAPLAEDAVAQVAQAWTGLVVDARGLAVKPALSPRIVDQQGRELYGSAQVSREYAIEQGMAGYAVDLDAAKRNPRVAGNPLVVKAVSVTGGAATDLVVSDAQAEVIRRVAQGQKFLEQCRVMIVID